jgi:hypothetical protein
VDHRATIIISHHCFHFYTKETGIER